MKNLPDKIYLATTEEIQNLDSSFVGIAHSNPKDIIKPIEYIRKDAFTEKAKKAMIEWAGTYISKTTGGGVKERKALANDLLSYFKKYMKL